MKAHTASGTMIHAILDIAVVITHGELVIPKVGTIVFVKIVKKSWWKVQISFSARFILGIIGVDS